MKAATHLPPSIFDQTDYQIRCEWGLEGARRLAPHCDVIIIVDILSFTTAVTIAAARGAIVFPYRWKDPSGISFAQAKQAMLAGPRQAAPRQAGPREAVPGQTAPQMAHSFSLSPSSLLALRENDRLVLPSPNGATVSLATGSSLTFAACFRNARAVARTANREGKTIGIIPCGEQWQEQATLRPSLEDHLGAGAVIHSLEGTRSPEAAWAEGAFLHAKDHLREVLLACSSGRELLAKGQEADVLLAAETNVDEVCPRLLGEAYVRGPRI